MPQNVEEVDGGSFNPYAIPDPDIVRKKVERRKMEEQNRFKSSENQQLLKDALQDLSGDESPPEIPTKKFLPEETVKVSSQVSVGSQEKKIQKGSKQVQEEDSQQEQGGKSQNSLKTESNVSSSFIMVIGFL